MFSSDLFRACGRSIHAEQEQLKPHDRIISWRSPYVAVGSIYVSLRKNATNNEQVSESQRTRYGKLMARTDVLDSVDAMSQRLAVKIIETAI